jgi:hypothetical protein
LSRMLGGGGMIDRAEKKFYRIPVSVSRAE